MIALVSSLQPSNPIVNLVGDRLTSNSATGAETAIVAESAAANGHFAIDVWASETCINADLLNSHAEFAFQEKTVGKVSQTRVAPTRTNGFYLR